VLKHLLLARQDVEVNQATAHGSTALILASRDGHIELVRPLLERRGIASCAHQ
jgi:hypothetical protein